MKEAIFFIIAGIVILSLAGLLIYLNPSLISFKALEQNKTIHVQEMPISFDIAESYIIGINTDRNLNLGPVGRGNSVTKSINITNPFNIPVKVSISFSEDINKFIEIPENNFVLEFNEVKRVPVTVKAPKNASLESYNGTLKLIMERV
jgi:hypothetical protein